MPETVDEWTSIFVRKSTHNRLTQAKKNHLESYNSLILRLLDSNQSPEAQT